MIHHNNTHGTSLPHHRLLAYHKALELLAAVRAAQIRDAKLRDEALRAAKGTCLNLAENAGRFSRADKARAYAIARGEPEWNLQRSGRFHGGRRCSRSEQRA
jgi:hypothetical protein